jgi:hypothetical protein
MMIHSLITFSTKECIFGFYLKKAFCIGKVSLTISLFNFSTSSELSVCKKLKKIIELYFRVMREKQFLLLKSALKIKNTFFYG